MAAAQGFALVQLLPVNETGGDHSPYNAISSVALDEMRDVAQSGIEFARQKLTPEQRAYLAGLPLTSSSESCQFVHASLNAPNEWHYVMREPGRRKYFSVKLPRGSGGGRGGRVHIEVDFAGFPVV